jgi:hypothetical protein
MPDDDQRALRDALEKAQAHALELSQTLEAQHQDFDERLLNAEDYIETLHGLLERETNARNEAMEMVEKLHLALDEAETPEPPLMSPGEHRQVVKLRAEVVALKHMRDRLQAEHERALETIEALRQELLRLKKKK